jgi:hypothetical protein
MNVSISYKAKWRLKDKPNYVWTSCKKLVNTNTGREIKRTIKGLKAGYWIGDNFIELDELRGRLELIPKKEFLPF